MDATRGVHVTNAFAVSRANAKSTKSRSTKFGFPSLASISCESVHRNTNHVRAFSSSGLVLARCSRHTRGEVSSIRVKVATLNRVAEVTSTLLEVS